MRMRSILAAAAVLTLTAGLAHAQEAMSTAGATGQAPSEIDLAGAAPAPGEAQPSGLVAPLDTAQQIQRWLAESPIAAQDAYRDALGDKPLRDGKIHGEVGVAVGTGGYRSGYITSVMPLGETGSLTLSIGQEKNGYGLGGGYWRDGRALRRGEPLGPPL